MSEVRPWNGYWLPSEPQLKHKYDPHKGRFFVCCDRYEESRFECMKCGVRKKYADDMSSPNVCRACAGIGKKRYEKRNRMKRKEYVRRLKRESP